MPLPIPPWLWLAILVGLIVLYFLTRSSGKRSGPGPRGPAGPETEGDEGWEKGDRADSGQPGGQESGESRRDRKEKASWGGKDPYEVLGVSRDASFDEVRRRYRERLLEVHPDRVQHLGGEFRDLAEKKTLELNEAFRRIQAERRWTQ